MMAAILLALAAAAAYIAYVIPGELGLASAIAAAVLFSAAAIVDAVDRAARRITREFAKRV